MRGKVSQVGTEETNNNGGFGQEGEDDGGYHHKRHTQKKLNACTQKAMHQGSQPRNTHSRRCNKISLYRRGELSHQSRTRKRSRAVGRVRKGNPVSGAAKLKTQNIAFRRLSVRVHDNE
jgi:hypothetical protein